MTVRINFNEIPSSVYLAMTAAESSIKTADIDKKLGLLIKLHVSQYNQCAYCVDMYSKELLAQDCDLQKLYSVQVYKKVNYYSDIEKHCLAWAEYLTEPSSTKIGDAAFSGLLEYFSKDQIAQLSLLITHINSWNRLMKAFAIPAGDYHVGQFENQ